MTNDQAKRGLAGPERVLVLVPPQALPDRWSDRAMPLVLVALLPEEIDNLLASHHVDPLADKTELALIRLLAAGHPVNKMARDLSLAPRSVYRRLAKLRRRYRVDSNTELAAELVRAGF